MGHAGSRNPILSSRFSHIFHCFCIVSHSPSCPIPDCAETPIAGGGEESELCSESTKCAGRLRLRHFSLTSAEREPAHTAHTPVLAWTCVAALPAGLRGIFRLPEAESAGGAGARGAAGGSAWCPRAWACNSKRDSTYSRTVTFRRTTMMST